MYYGFEVNRFVRELSHLTGTARDITDFLQKTNHLMQKIIGWDYAAWSLVDPGTTLTTNTLLFDAKFDPRVRSKVIELEYAGKDINLLSDLARARQPAESLNIATQGNPSKSRRFRELSQQISFRDELRAVFKYRGMVWGFLIAYRTPDSKLFSEADIWFISRVGQVIAEGLRYCLLRTAAEASHGLPDSPGLMLLSNDGRMLETTPTAERWLSLVGDSGNWSTPVYAVAAKIKMDNHIVHLPVRAKTGQWILLHGSPTRNGIVAIIVEEARGAYLHKVISDQYELTARERIVTGYILRGLSTKEIGRNLGISHYTVQDHLKSIFNKVGVRSRLELGAVFFNQHYMERLQTGSIPSPYGWYLDNKHS